MRHSHDDCGSEFLVSRALVFDLKCVKMWMWKRKAAVLVDGVGPFSFPRTRYREWRRRYMQRGERFFFSGVSAGQGRR